MKTREEIQQEYERDSRAIWEDYWTKTRVLITNRNDNLHAAEVRRDAALADAALAELDDPMLRLIAAARNVLADQIARDPEHGDRLCLICRRISDPDSRMLLFHNQDCSAADLRDAIAYAEARRVAE